MIVVKWEIDEKVLDRWIARQDTTCDKAIEAIAFQVEAEAKVLAPVKTGALKNSIHTSKESDANYIVSDGVLYGIFQELGTRFMAAHPFLVPALEKVKRMVIDILKKEYSKL